MFRGDVNCNDIIFEWWLAQSSKLDVILTDFTMDNYPKILNTYLTERQGVLKTALALNNLGLIFRETPNADVGIDGQIEYVNLTNQAVGKLVAAQIKSGSSYLNDKGDHWAFYAEEKHKLYWVSYPIPVIVFIHNPDDQYTYYTDVKYQLSIPNRSTQYIAISKQSILEKSTKDQLFSSIGEIGDIFLEPAQLFQQMAETRCNNPTFSISFLDLFIQGLTNLSRHLFFSMQMAMDIAEFNNKSEYDLGLGFTEHEFLNNYVKFLLKQNLANIDYADYLIDWKERHLQPTFLAPLTWRGKQLLEYVSEQEFLYKDILPPTRLTSERLLRIGYPLMETLRFQKMADLIRAVFKNDA